MNVKKMLILAVAAATLAMGSVTAFAHCHGGGHGCGGRRTAATSYTVCNVEGCQLTDGHYHDDCYYYGHYAGDGHQHHFENCPYGCASGYCIH